jgi:hypothetical protein
MQPRIWVDPQVRPAGLSQTRPDLSQLNPSTTSARSNESRLE